jgi:hypothetical protein
MSNAQTRSQKTKAASKVAGHGVMVASQPKKGNSELRPGSGPSISAQERQILIAQLETFCAEKCGFAPAGKLQDWV